MSKRCIEVIARALIVDGRGRVLFCQNRKGNYYYLPGGHVEHGESARAAAERELLEECGEIVATGHLVLVLENQFGRERQRTHEYSLIFEATRVRRSGKVESLEKHITFEWLSTKQLATRDVRPESIRAWLERRTSRRTAKPKFISSM